MTFPLVPRGRLVGLSFGTMRSLRRGAGSDVAGSRPYRTGDDVHLIDWAASARISSARGTDEFIVRERFADEAPRVVVVCDRRPAMASFVPPWLDKAQAMREATELVLQSTALVGGFAGYLDHADGEPYWLAPQGGRKLWELREHRLPSTVYRAPEDSLERSLAHLAEHRLAVPSGTFLFLLSDFLSPPSDRAWLTALEHRWDVVPVVIQDPVWEQSFPDVSGIVVPLRDPRSGRIREVRMTRREARERRAANEERREALTASFEALDVDPVLVSDGSRVEILSSFLSWSELRRGRRAA